MFWTLLALFNRGLNLQIGPTLLDSSSLSSSGVAESGMFCTASFLELSGNSSSSSSSSSSPAASVVLVSAASPSPS
ncbi:hypothetical protein WICPIJ_008885 [Wickerhamomyces pijperi]|uniref:Secreted protein n=1 Tax=Wickerhamomyces pijperi TaxID=599730 RepID=A0A9P8PV98_WICPI|nr:hypothetical protein WICPIJ_008885 [Wickerhamomyces pijperi]